jgi:hypothetical protein
MVGMKNIPWCVPYYCTGQRTMFPVVSGAGTAQQNVRRHMSKDEMISKWHPIDKAALLELSKYTTSPGIHQLGTTALPFQIQPMPGAASYFISAYSNPVNLGNNTMAGGELAVVRNDNGLWKAYNYIFASSGDGRVCFNGPYKNFPEHHFSTTASISLESLFGHFPQSTQGSV